MFGRHRSTTTSMLNNMLTHVPQDSGPKCSWKRTVVPKEESCSENSKPAKHAKVEEARSVLPIGDSTERHQAGVHRHPLHRHPDSGSCLRRELFVGLADVAATNSTATQTSALVVDERSHHLADP